MRALRWMATVALGLLLPLATDRPACAEKPLARVNVITARITEFAPELALTGDIEPQVQTNVGFRTSGKIISRDAEIGQRVGADEVIARLDPRDQESGITAAEATLSSAQATLRQAEASFQRQQELMRGGFTTRPAFDQAQEAFRTAQGSVMSAEAALGVAREQLGYTELRPGVSGIIVDRSAEEGQVVQSGQTVFTIAVDGPRDAVFNVHEALVANPPPARGPIVALAANPRIQAQGVVREVSPTVAADTATVRVKVTLDPTPPEMALGSSVIGYARFASRPVVSIPWSALFRWQRRPAVWIVDPQNSTVSIKTVGILHYTAASVILSDGVSVGDLVVSAGTQLLHPGQMVEVARKDTP